MRERELQEACRQLGVQHVTCLDYGDGKLEEIDPRVLAGHVAKTIRTFRPDIVFTFGEEGAYGHPDHIAISVATTEGYRLAGDPEQFPDQIAEGLAPHAPSRLYHSHFPRHRLLLLDHLVRWLKGLDDRFRGTKDFVQGLTLFASESSTMGYHSDHVNVGWYPPSFYIIEQGEPPSSLYFILSGEAEVVREDPDGTMRKLSQIGPGQFFGEEGIATGNPRNANVIALDSVTCLVLSPDEPSRFAGRGEEAQFATVEGLDSAGAEATTCIDVSDFVGEKMAAIAAHRTQHPISPDMFPHDALVEMLGREYFVRIQPPIELETDLLPTGPQ